MLELHIVQGKLVVSRLPMRQFRQKLCSGNRPLDSVCEYKDHVDKVDKIHYIIRTRATRGYFELFSVEGIETLCKAFKVIDRAKPKFIRAQYTKKRSGKRARATTFHAAEYN
jgi:hypothetical protein